MLCTFARLLPLTIERFLDHGQALRCHFREAIVTVLIMGGLFPAGGGRLIVKLLHQPVTGAEPARQRAVFDCLLDTLGATETLVNEVIEISLDADEAVLTRYDLPQPGNGE
jgi:hypothetical protein